MKKKTLLSGLALCISLPMLLTMCYSVPRKGSLPCDIYGKGGTPCVAAHSTTRLLGSKYSGPLYQVMRDSDGKTMDIYATDNGYANTSAQDDFCKGTLCYITIIYDQSGLGNDLTQAGPGTFKGPDKGEYNTLPIADMAPALLNGHKVYGAYIMPGMGFRCNNATGLAINDEPEGIYYVIDGTHFDNGCCFDYGNSSTNGRAVGTGTMETTYYGTSTNWGSGNGEGPWIMSDMEAGLFSGYGAKKNDVPSIQGWRFVSVFMNGGGGNHWDLRGGDATQDSLVTYYSGVRPGSNDGSDAYYPMHKKGGMLLGNGGDNGNGSAGTFYEGVMTMGYPGDETINAVQKSISTASYREYPVKITRITEFAPLHTQSITVAITNTIGKTMTDVSLGIDAPEGWTSVADDRTFSLEPSETRVQTVILKAPAKRSSGFAKFDVIWNDGSASLSERVRCTEPVRINEIQLSQNGDGQFIEIFNAGDEPVDMSGVELRIRRSGWAQISAATMPSGTIIPAGGFYLFRLADIAVTLPARQGDTEIYLSRGDADMLFINGQIYNIKEAGTPAGNLTTVFSPVSLGKKLKIAAGATNIPVTSIQGFEAGQVMGIDLGGNFEKVTVTKVGTAATLTTLSNEAKAGDTTLTLAATSNLIPGLTISINTGARIEYATIKEVIKSAWTPERRPGQPRRSSEPGIISIEEPLKNDHMQGVDVICNGSGITFTPATSFDHFSGDAIQPLGTPFKLSEALCSDVTMYQAATFRPGIQNYQAYGYAASEQAGSIALLDPATGTVLDAIVYGSRQSNSSANGTIASPDLAILESAQDGGGNIAVVPSTRPFFPGFGQRQEPVTAKSLARCPDGNDTDNLFEDFTISDYPTPGSSNKKE